MSSKTKQLTLATTEAVKQIGHSVQSAINPRDAMYECESPTQARTLQYTRRGLKMVGEKSVFDLKEPIWHPDEKSPVCDKCRSSFTLITRRHHCRRCGDVVCGHCCERTQLTRMGYVDPVLVCHKCVPMCRMEEEFMLHHIKPLITGAHFHLSDSQDPNQVFNLKLSSDHKQLLVDNDHLPINMRHILEVKSLTGDQLPIMDQGDDVHRKRRGSGGIGKLTSLELVLKGSRGQDEGKLILTSTNHHRKIAVEWLKSLKKALIILHTTK